MEASTGLVDLCMDAATRSADAVERWRRRRRTLERLPSHLANELFRRLRRRLLLFPSLLEVFQFCVEDIDLSGETNVDAEWLAYLGAFRYLRRLNLADCRAINNAAVWPITGMGSLKELDLSRCLKISDAGMEHMLSNSNLEKLFVSETSLTSAGIMRLKSLRHLRVLDLGGRPVSDAALCSLQILTQLEILDIWGSEISNEGASLLKDFPKLSVLNLAWTNVSKLPDLPSITCLNMSYCIIASIFDGQSRSMAPLAKLLVSGATFIDPDESFINLPVNKLSFLDLSRSSLSNFHFLVNMKCLEHLNLSLTGIDDNLIDPIICIGESLRYLNLNNTGLSSQGVAGLTGHVPNLEILSLSHTSVDDSALFYIGMMPALKEIDLSKTSIKGFTCSGPNSSEKSLSLGALQSLSNLESLNLEETYLGDETLSLVANLKELKTLSLKGDFISDASLLFMSRLPNLQCLGIRGAVLTNSGLLMYNPPAMLRLLDLRGCWLLTESDLLEFCKSHPRIEVKHEHGPIFCGDKNALASSSSQFKFSGGKLPQQSPKSKYTFVDERIKYRREEMLDLQFSRLSIEAGSCPHHAWLL